MPRLLEPIFPRPQDIKPETTSYAALSEDEKDKFQVLRKRHKTVKKEYRKQKAALTSLRSYITSIVAKNLNTYILGIDSVYDTLVAPKERVAPTDTAHQLYLSTQYTEIKMGPRNQNFEAWLQPGLPMMNECIFIPIIVFISLRALRYLLSR